jgi:glucokinase
VSETVIGIDLGGTRVKAGLVVGDNLSEVLVERVGDKDQDTIVATLAALVGRLDPSGRAAVGLAAAGVLDAHAGLVRESPNFPLWRDFPLGRDLASATGRRVTLENDANAVILGEARYGVAQGRRSVIGYTLGTGVGGGLVLDGRLYRGERGMAGELGHVTVEPEGRPCNCGNRGCLERYAGQGGLHLSAVESPLIAPLIDDPRDTPRQLLTLATGSAQIPQEVSAAARAVFERAGRYLGQATAALVHTLDVTTIVLAGGIAGAFPFLASALEAELVARTFRSMSRGVTILQGTLDTQAGLLGAAAVARDHL